MTVVLIARDLIISSRVSEAALRAGTALTRIDGPDQLPLASEVSLVLVDWGERGPGWGQQLVAWCAGAPETASPRMILFGPHTDLAAHADARASGLGPMRARSKLLAELPDLLR